MKKKTIVQRRIAIIKDAIAQLEAGHCRASHCGYIYLPVTMSKVVSENPEASAQKLFGKLTKQKHCKVCAKGSLFVSLINKENELCACEIPDDNYRVTTRLTEGGLFSIKNIALVEIFYESWGVDSYENYETGETKAFSVRERSILAAKVRDLDRKYPPGKNKERLLYILKNMLKNKGIFKP